MNKKNMQEVFESRMDSTVSYLCSGIINADGYYHEMDAILRFARDLHLISESTRETLIGCILNVHYFTH